jgi:hypothetical protein
VALGLAGALRTSTNVAALAIRQTAAANISRYFAILEIECVMEMSVFANRLFI